MRSRLFLNSSPASLSAITCPAATAKHTHTRLSTEEQRQTPARPPPPGKATLEQSERAREKETRRGSRRSPIRKPPASGLRVAYIPGKQTVRGPVLCHSGCRLLAATSGRPAASCLYAVGTRATLSMPRNEKHRASARCPRRAVIEARVAPTCRDGGGRPHTHAAPTGYSVILHAPSVACKLDENALAGAGATPVSQSGAPRAPGSAACGPASAASARPRLCARRTLP